MVEASQIYKIVNTVNDKVYIGASSCITTRWGQHKQDMKKFSHRPLYQAMCEFGIDKFSIHVIESLNGGCRDKREQYWIDHYNSLYPGGYNAANTYSVQWLNAGRWDEQSSQ